MGLIINPYSVLPVAPAVDPQWANVVSLLSFDGANGSAVFVDDKGLSWAVGDDSAISDPIVQTTTDAKFGVASLRVTSNRFITCSSASLNMGTSNFTIEGWFKPDVDTGQFGGVGFFWIKGNNDTGNLMLGIHPGGVFWRTAGAGDLGYAETISTSAWTHIAFVRSGNNHIVYINFVRRINTDVGAVLDYTHAANTRIGSPVFDYGTYEYSGLMDELRVTKFARYTGATISPPITSAFPKQ